MVNKRIPGVTIWPEPSAAGDSASGAAGAPGIGVFDVATDPRFSGGAVGDGAANDRAALAAMDAADHDNYVPQAEDAFLVGSDLTVTRATWFAEGGILRPSGAGVDIVFNEPIVAGSWQVFDESLGGTVTLLEYDVVNVCWYGCSASLSQAENTAIIKSLLLRYRSLIIPAFVVWDGYVTTSAETGQTFTWDGYHRQWIVGGQCLRFPKNDAKSYIEQTPFVRGNRETGIWAMPNGDVTQTSGAPPWPAAAFKAFLDNYSERAANPDIWGNVDYRDCAIIAQIIDGAQGFGVVAFNTKSNGRYIPFAPEMHFSLYATQIPMRIMRVQPSPAVAGNYFTPGPAGIYYFDPAMPIWAPDHEVVQGQLVNECGKIYEAQSSGTTGDTPIVHATYRKKRLTLSSVTGTFVVGETMRVGSGSTAPNGDLETDEGGGDYLLQYWNQIDFALGTTITGLTSGASGTIDAVADVDVDVDNNDNNFVPPGPAVKGRIESDGLIDWLFLDNIIGYIRGNESMKGIVLLGDDPDLLPFPGFNDAGTHIIEDALVYQGRRIRFVDETGEEADAGIGRTTNNKLEIKGPPESNGEVHIYPRFGGTGYLRVLGSQVTTNELPFVWPRVTKNDLATTLSMATANYAVFSDSAPTNFTQFTNLRNGQPIYVRFTTGNTTLVHDSTKIQLPGGVNLTPAANTTYVFLAHSTSAVSMVRVS